MLQVMGSWASPRNEAKLILLLFFLIYSEDEDNIDTQTTGPIEVSYTLVFMADTTNVL